MQKLPLLKSLTTILLLCTGAFVAFAIPFFIMAIVVPDKIPFHVNEKLVTDFAIEEYILLAFNILAVAFYAYALYLFKDVLNAFAKKRLFANEVISNLDQAGKAVLIGFAVYVVPEFLYTTIYESSFSISLSFDSLFTPMVGLFLIVLSEVLLIAKNLKEENDLTV
jgi:hypothetical protein